MSTVVEMVLDGKYSELKEHVEGLVATKLAEKIKSRKSEIISQINENKSSK